MNKLKLAQDRSAMLISYDIMVRILHTPRKNRVSRAQFAAMGNTQVMQVCKDLYNNSTVKQAKKIKKAMEPKVPLSLQLLSIKRYIKLRINTLRARIYLWNFHRQHDKKVVASE